MYIAFGLASLLWIAGYFHTGRLVRPKWKIPGKYVFYVGVSVALAWWLGPWCLLFIVLHPLIGLLFHIRVCQKHGIDWRTVQPREKYMELQEKWARGDFS